MADEIQFSLIIPSWNRCHSLDKTLRNLLCQKKLRYEIIVVDNGSTDDTKTVCQRLRQKNQQLHYIPLAENKGVPYAVNQGIHRAQGKIIACIDDDEFSHDEYLLEKIAWLAKEKQWGILNIDRVDKANKATMGQQLFPYHKKAKRGHSFYVHNFCNGTVFIKREVIEKIGLFEETYFRQAQENEYALRAIVAGFEVLHCPQLVLQHISDPFILASDQVFYYSLRNTMLMNYKYFSGWQLLMMNGWQVIHYLSKTIRADLSAALFLQALREYRQQKKNTVRHLNYNADNMQRYFFVSRKIAYRTEEIGRMSFLHYFVSGCRRFVH